MFGGATNFGVGDTIKATGLSITDTNPQSMFTDARKYVYIKHPNSKHFYRASDLSRDEESSEFDNNATGLEVPQSAFVSQAKLPEHGGTYMTCRLYPRQDADYEATFRYHFRPNILRDDTDVPQMPADTHLYLAIDRDWEKSTSHIGSTVFW